jgi:hypothetical protein
MPAYVDCRCPKCGHIRGQAAENSHVKLQCRQDRIYFFGVVKGGKFRLTGTANVRRRVESAPPPSYRG